MLRTGTGKGKGQLHVNTMIHLLCCVSVSNRVIGVPSLPFPHSSQTHTRPQLVYGCLPEHLVGSQKQVASLGQWTSLAPGARRLAPRCLSATSEPVPDERQGLGGRGLFVPLWQMVGAGSRRNRLEIVSATQTFRRDQCTPLCNNTNFVAAEKSIFSPLKRAPAASGSSGGP